MRTGRVCAAPWDLNRFETHGPHGYIKKHCETPGIPRSSPGASAEVDGRPTLLNAQSSAGHCEGVQTENDWWCPAKKWKYNVAILCQSFALWIMKDLRSLTAIGQILSQMDWRFLCIFYCRCRCHFNFKVTTPILTLTPTERRFGSAVLFDLIATWYQAIPGSFCWQLARSLFHAPQDDRFSNTCGNVALCSMCKHKFKLQGGVISKGKCLLVATQRNASRCIQNSRQAQAVWCLLWFTLSVILALKLKENLQYVKHDLHTVGYKVEVK